MNDTTATDTLNQLSMIASHLQQIVTTLGSIDRNLEHIAKGTPDWAQVPEGRPAATD